MRLTRTLLRLEHHPHRPPTHLVGYLRGLPRSPVVAIAPSSFPSHGAFADPSLIQTAFDATLSKRNTPDWLIYLRAAEAGFDAMVTRDANQLSLQEEMWVPTRIRLILITFRQPIEDPIVERRQLLAYLPAVRRRADKKSSQIILLPRPTLSAQNAADPKEGLHQLADEQRVSVQQVRRDAERNVAAVLVERGMDGRFDRFLRHGRRLR